MIDSAPLCRLLYGQGGRNRLKKERREESAGFFLKGRPAAAVIRRLAADQRSSDRPGEGGPFRLDLIAVLAGREVVVDDAE